MMVVNKYYNASQRKKVVMPVLFAYWISNFTFPHLLYVHKWGRLVASHHHHLMFQLLHDFLPKHLLLKNDCRGIVARMKCNFPFALHFVVKHERDALFVVKPQAEWRQATGFQREQLGQTITGCKRQTRHVQKLTGVGGAEGLIRQGDVQIKGRLLAITQQNVLTEGDVGRDKRKRQALLHGRNGIVMIDLAGEGKGLQTGKNALFVGHGDNLLLKMSVLDVKNSRKEEQNRQFRQNDGGNFATSML